MLDALLMWDERLFRLLNAGWPNAVLDRLLAWISDARTFTLPFILAAIMIMLIGRMRGLRFLVLAVVSVVVADAIGTHIIKYSFLRPRPCNALADVRQLLGCTSLPSFPSNHAVNASVLATLATLSRPRLWPLAMAVVFLIGYSRVYVGVHYPLDVVAGSILGIIVALTFSRIMHLLWPPASEAAERPRLFSLNIGDR